MNKTLKESLQFIVGAAYTAKDALMKGIDRLKEEDVLDEAKSKKTFQKKAKEIQKKFNNLSQKKPKKSTEKAD